MFTSAQQEQQWRLLLRDWSLGGGCSWNAVIFSLHFLTLHDYMLCTAQFLWTRKGEGPPMLDGGGNSYGESLTPAPQCTTEPAQMLMSWEMHYHHTWQQHFPFGGVYIRHKWLTFSIFACFEELGKSHFLVFVQRYYLQSVMLTAFKKLFYEEVLHFLF